MSRRRAEAEAVPPCYAQVLPGLEPVAADEIPPRTSAVRSSERRAAWSFSACRRSTTSLLRLRTVEDVFVLAWGTDQLSYRAEDLEKIRRWTARGPTGTSCCVCTTPSGPGRRAGRPIAW